MENTMNYKGYIGSVSFSDNDNCFFGKIEGISDLVNYEGESVTELRQAFHDAVDYYLDFCKEHNKEPETSFGNTVNVELAPEIQWKIKQFATKAGISVSAYIRQTLSKAVSILP